MTLVWLNNMHNYWQGIGDPNTSASDAKNIPSPKAGDMYLDINTRLCYTYDPEGVTKKWFVLNG